MLQTYIIEIPQNAQNLHLMRLLLSYNRQIPFVYMNSLPILKKLQIDEIPAQDIKPMK